MSRSGEVPAPRSRGARPGLRNDGAAGAVKSFFAPPRSAGATVYSGWSGRVRRARRRRRSSRRRRSIRRRGRSGAPVLRRKIPRKAGSPARTERPAPKRERLRRMVSRCGVGTPPVLSPACHSFFRNSLRVLETLLNRFFMASRWRDAVPGTAASARNQSPRAADSARRATPPSHAACRSLYG